MLLKLPIIIDNKVVFTLFKLVKYDTYYLLSLFDNIINDNINCDIISDKLSKINEIKQHNIIKIMISNNITGYEYYNIYLPLKLFIVDNLLISIYFFIMYFYSLNIFNINYDFFYYLNITLKNNNLELIKKENYIKYQNEIFKIINSEYLLLNNNKKYNKEFWELINLLLNTSLFILWLNYQNITNIKISKKILNITNIIKKIKYTIDNSNEYTFCEHIINKNNENILLNNLIINNIYYLLIDNKKYLLVKIIEKDNNFIKLENFSSYIQYEKYKWYKYCPDIGINEEKIYYYLFFNKITIYNLINKSNPKINNIDNIIDYFLNEQIKSKLFPFILENNNNDESLTELNIIKSNSYTTDFFKSICNKYVDNFHLILEILFSNYLYPIKYNKKEIDNIFDNILYISLLNLNKILNIDKEKLFINQNINIPNKLKPLYFNILKTFYQIINKNKETVKYISDLLHVQFIKIFLSSNSNTIELLKNKVSIDEINSLKKKLLINFTIHDIIKKINWSNINKKLHYLKFLLNNKDSLYFFDKLNKNIFSDNFDDRIKNIIINPVIMFRYLRKENDFIKWSYFLENKCNDLYYINFTISYDDLLILGKIIYCLLNIKEQNFNDKYYKKLIYYGIKYPKLILDNNRINIKIKESFGFLKCNLNLGIIAKHLNQNKNNYIEFNDDIENNEIIILKNKLNIITNKYLKYKKKYYNIKKSNII